MDVDDEGNEQKWLAIEIEKLQNQALKRARNLKRAKSALRRTPEAAKKEEKIQIAEKKYSIEKVHQKNEIKFVSSLVQSKELVRKMCAQVKLQKLSFQHIIGCGMLGTVWKVEDRCTHKLYAVKEISKQLVFSSQGLGPIMNERNFITQINFHLVPQLISSFQTDTHLYFGDLRYHLSKFQKFTEKEARFFVACIVSVLEYLREQGIIHRDIKPENLLLDQAGYLYLSDFGVAIKSEEAGKGKCCGTPAYMAPEVLFEKQYNFQTDYYALGVVLYEMIMGQRPCKTTIRQQIIQHMLKHSAHIKKDQIPEGWSVEAADFVNRLLHRNVTNRLGAKGVNQIKQHPWIKKIDWQKLKRREIVSPYCEPFNNWEVNFKQMISFRQKSTGKKQKILVQEMQQLFRFFTYETFEKSVDYTTKPSFELRG